MRKIVHFLIFSISFFFIFHFQYLVASNTNQPIVTNNLKLMWLDTARVQPDTHVAFRGKLKLHQPTEVNLLLSGSSWYVIWLNGTYFYEGPDRYHPNYPEYQVKKISLPAGEHTFAIHVLYEGVETRMLKDIQAFLTFTLLDKNKNEIHVDWKCSSITGYDSQFRRISGQFGWVEWVDTRKIPENWQHPSFDDSNWQHPVEVKRAIGSFSPSNIPNVESRPFQPTLIANGPLAEVYGYERDNISARFFLRDLKCKNLPPTGVWRRYDLGRVRLFRPRFVMDLPAGTVVEFAYSEQLLHYRVSPWISLSLTDSYNLDHFVAKGGVQEFFPLKPKGGRFMEVHILATQEKVKMLSEEVMDRCIYEKQDGHFATDDPLLNRIWQVGIDTHMSCAEDALIDNPTRERGQWLADIGIIGMQIAGVGFDDIRVCRRGLVQSAQSARQDGLVAGLSPGGEVYITTFAAQWVVACMEYWKLTGDKTLLEDMFLPAQRNIDAFLHYLDENGVSNEAGWPFVDWGYVPSEDKTDMGVNMHVYLAIKAMQQWAKVMGDKTLAKHYSEIAGSLQKVIKMYLENHRAGDDYDWKAIGYHRTVLTVLNGFVDKKNTSGAVKFIKEHILNCFPNNPNAPRLSDPNANNPQLITPYFSHYAFQVLIEQGEMDFVLDQYRTSWGWMLQDNRTTWMEVFDTRWSHAHQWAGSPTWQLSRYLLGLHPRFDQKMNHFGFNLITGSLNNAEGTLPLSHGNKIMIKWVKNTDHIIYQIHSTVPVTLEIPKNIRTNAKREIKINGKYTLKIYL